MKTVILLLISSLMVACSTTKMVYVEPKPYTFQKTPVVEAYSIRVHPDDDAALYSEYIDTLKAYLKFHNKQIDDYNASMAEDK